MLRRLVTFFSLAVLATGCGASFRAVEPAREVPGTVRVELVQSRGDLIVASLTNQGRVPLMLNRDAVY